MSPDAVEVLARSVVALRLRVAELEEVLEAAYEELREQAGGPKDQTEEEAELLERCRAALADMRGGG